MADVVLNQNGKTKDGKPMFEVVCVADIPTEVVGQKGEKQNTPNMIVDEFGILRPKRSWLAELYGSATERLRS